MKEIKIDKERQSMGLGIRLGASSSHIVFKSPSHTLLLTPAEGRPAGHVLHSFQRMLC